jgi:hypothetical protein
LFEVRLIEAMQAMSAPKLNMDVVNNIRLLRASRLTPLLMALSLVACSEPESGFRSGPPPNAGYGRPPGGYGYYQPPDERDMDEDDEDNPDRSSPEDSDSSNRTTDDSDASRESPDHADSQPDTNNATPTPSSLPTAKSLGNGRVESPYAPGKQVDVEGFPPGSTVRDPYTGQIFIVPVPKSGSP